MKWLIIPFCLWFGCLSFAQEHKPKIRALLAIDLVSKNISRGDLADMYRLQKSLHGIAHQLHLSCNITTLKKESMTKTRLDRWLRSIPQNSKDIVLFYFTGHGQRLPQMQSPWPLMFFKSSEHPLKETAIAGEAIYQALRNKHPRLSIILMNACNCLPTAARLIELSPPYRPIIDGKHRLPGLRSLFLKTKGMVISAAAAPGEYAYSYGGKRRNSGSFFATGLLSAIKNYGRAKNPTWKKVFVKTGTHCHYESNGTQHPIFAIQP
jgi:hypothetical protein